jgi:hypothetical protein
MDRKRLEKLAEMGDESARAALKREDSRTRPVYNEGETVEVPVKRLHMEIQTCLKRVGYHRGSVRVLIRTHYNRIQNPGFEGCRGYTYAVNVPGGTFELKYMGPYGGERRESTEYLPKAWAIVQGEIGSRGCFMDVVMRPEQAAQWIDRETHADVTLDEAASQALALLAQCKSSYRAKAFKHGVWSNTHPAIVHLISLGFAKKHGRGVKATPEGKAYAANNRLRYY